MPYTSTRRVYHMFGKKTSRYAMYRKAKKMCSDIYSKLSVLESRFLKSRLHHV